MSLLVMGANHRLKESESSFYQNCQTLQMFYVEGLRVNLLRISQICDQDFMVQFSKGKCLIMDESGKKLISGVRTLENCYGLVPDVDILCNSICLPNEDLWHERMGHAN